MNSEPDPALDPSGELLDGELLAGELLDYAIRAAKTQLAPDEIRQRVLETAAAWGRSSTQSDPPAPGQTIDLPMPVLNNGDSGRATQMVSSHSRRHGRWGLAALITIATVATVMLWLTSPNESWAQVADALRKQPWSLAKYTTPDGEVHEDWISFSRDVSAFRHSERLQFTDHRLNVTYVYDTKKRTLTRDLYSDGAGQKRAHRWFDAVFQQMSTGAEKLAYAAPGVEVVEKKRGTVTKHQRNWLSYDLIVRAVGVDASDPESSVQLNFLVDPQTRLPHYLTLNQPSMDPQTVEMELSYPERGPIDIYDLGVPRDAKLIDLVPSNDIQRILAGIKASAERFEPYRALNVLYDAGNPWYAGTPFVVWRKGTSDRHVYGLVDSDSVLPAPPASNADPKEWWKRRWTELFHVPHEVCDGSTFWTNEAHPAGWDDQPYKPNPITWKRAEFPRPKWKSRPEQDPWPAGSAPLYLAYPPNLVRFRSTQGQLILDATSTDGPKNTVKIIERSVPTENVTWETRYWIDTQRSYMVVRSETVTQDASKTPPLEVMQISQLVETAEQSPSGIWYPTVIRHGFQSKERPLGTLTRHYLDFNVKFPDDVFKPIERPGEPLE